MFKILTILISIITLVLLKLFLNIKFKDLKSLNNRGTDELKNIAKKFPNNIDICNAILKKLNIKNVNVKIESEYENCLYTVFNNTIILGKFKQDYMKPQTIAHECIHASQNKITLWSNFIISNIYLIYFIIISILTLFNKITNIEINIIILIFLSLIQYIVRNLLENDAMIRAKYIAKEYIEENNILSKNEEELLMQEYDEVNKIGITFMNYYLISINIMKIIIYSIIALI